MTAQTGNKMADSREPKVGDGVHVKLQIVEVGTYGWIGVKNSAGDTLGISRPDIVHIEPAPLKVGDRVKINNSSYKATISCIEGDAAWIKYDWTGTYGTVALSDLTRIEASDGAGS
jgi:hypothetical protein